MRGNGPGLLLAHGAGGGIDANYGPIMDTLAAQHTETTGEGWRLDG